MTTTAPRDLSSTLPVESESIVDCPPETPYWSENLLFSLYDATRDVGLWLHLGTEPSEWALWKERSLVFLPGDRGVLSMWSYHRTAPERRPAGASLAFQCIEPFRRWHLSFDGFGLHSLNEEMRVGRVRDGRKQRFALELDIECAVPVWDAHAAATSGTGEGSMASQGWATEHYEQLYTATGTVQLESGEIALEGTGWRDHSRGPRGEGAGTWGGHVVMGCLFPESGRAFGLSRFYDLDATITLAGGYVVGEDCILHHAEVVDAPRLRSLQLSGEQLPIRLRWPEGELVLHLSTVRSAWMSMTPGLPMGAGLEGPGTIYAVNFARCEWDGEVAYAYVERSDRLNDPAPELPTLGR
jgi:hypothetical protein